MKKNLKKVISAVLALTLAMSSFVAMTTSAATFADVADTASYAEAVNALAALGAIAGTGDGTFKPDDNITRAEAATMVVAALNLSADAQNAGTTSKFTDVNTQAKWAVGYVNVGVAQNYISGTSATTFNPLDNVTYAQMLTMLTRILGYGDFAVSRGGYPDGYVTSASIAGIVKGVAAGTEEPITRAQAAQLIWNAVQAPMLDITTFTGSINDTQLQQMDGTNGKKFKTVLSDKFDAYVLDVKVTDASTTGQGLDIGTIKMVRTNTNQWDPVNKFSISYVNDSDETVSRVYDDVAVGNTDAENYLFSSAKVVAEYNDDNEWKLVYFAPTAKVTTKKVDGTLVDAATTGTSLKIKKSATSRYTTDYTLSAGAVLYVNGVKYVDPTNADNDTIAENLATFKALLAESVGDTILYEDTAAVSGKSYDKVMINVYTIAKVQQVTSTETKTTVRLLSPDAPTGAATTGTSIAVTADQIEDGEKVVTVTKAGVASELSALAKGDVVAIKHDITKSFDAGVHFDILATTDVVTGQYTSADEEDKTFTVAGTKYEAVDYSSLNGDIEIGSTYTFLLDPFGRLYSAGDEVTSMTYAIVEKYTDTSAVSYEGNSEYDILTVVTLDGQQKTLYVDNTATLRTEIKDAMDIINDGNDDNDLASNGINKFAGVDLADRVISYGVKKSTGRVNKFDAVTVSAGERFSAEQYNALTNKLKKGLSSTAVVLDATAYENTVADANPADMKASSLSTIVPNVGYTGFLVHQNDSDNKYAYVVITVAGATYSQTSDFAVAAADAKESSKSTTEDEETIYTLRVMKDGAEEAVVLEIAEDVVVSKYDAGESDYVEAAYADDCVAKGDVFFYTVNAEGLVDRIDVVLSGVANFSSLADAGYAIHKPAGSEIVAADWFVDIDEDNCTAADEPVQLFLAPVVIGKDNSVSFGTVTVSDPDGYVETEDTFDFSIASDANIYFYDLSEDAPTNYTAFSGGYFTSLGNDFDDNGYAWFADVPAGEIDYNGIVEYAFVMAVDGVVTNAVVFGGEYVPAP